VLPVLQAELNPAQLAVADLVVHRGRELQLAVVYLRESQHTGDSVGSGEDLAVQAIVGPLPLERPLAIVHRPSRRKRDNVLKVVHLDGCQRQVWGGGKVQPGLLLRVNQTRPRQVQTTAAVPSVQ
jgi:hypothetical protein